MTNDLRKKIEESLGDEVDERVMKIVEEMVRCRIREELILSWVDVIYWSGR